MREEMRETPAGLALDRVAFGARHHFGTTLRPRNKHVDALEV